MHENKNHKIISLILKAGYLSLNTLLCHTQLDQPSLTSPLLDQPFGLQIIHNLYYSIFPSDWSSWNLPLSNVNNSLPVWMEMHFRKEQTSAMMKDSRGASLTIGGLIDNDLPSSSWVETSFGYTSKRMHLAKPLFTSWFV